MSTSTDWSSRPVMSALSPERLAAFVDRAVTRTEGLLFTATPTEELDAIGRWQHLKDQAFAGQMREIVAAYNRASGAQREFAADEVGLAVGATSTTGGNLVAQALSLAELPGLLEAVEGGVLTERHVLAVLRELDKVELSVEQRHAVVLVMLARYRAQAPGELAAMVARLIVQVDLAVPGRPLRRSACRFGDVDHRGLPPVPARCHPHHRNHGRRRERPRVVHRGPTRDAAARDRAHMQNVPLGRGRGSRVLGWGTGHCRLSEQLGVPG